MQLTTVSMLAGVSAFLSPFWDNRSWSHKPLCHLYTIELADVFCWWWNNTNVVLDSGLCQINTAVGLPLKNGCLFVNNSDELNLVDARSRCLDEGGDLATFEEDEDLRTLKQIRSSVLQNNTDYWIGLRLNWWIWNETGQRHTCTCTQRLKPDAVVL